MQAGLKDRTPVLNYQHGNAADITLKRNLITTKGSAVTQRAFTRIPYSTNVFIKTGSRTFTAPSIDISVRGVFVKTREHLTVGEPAEVDMVIPSASVGSMLKIPGFVTRVERGGAAIEFGRMDADTFTLLKNVLQRRATHRLKPYMVP